MSETLDFRATLEVIDELREIVGSLHAERVNVEANNKKVTAEKAAVNRDLLYAGHLAELVRVGVMNEYHRFKGQHPPHLVAG